MAWKELFTTDIGLLSVFTIGFVVVIGAYFGVYFSKKMNEQPGQK
jgi:hypothetical protein